MTQQDVIQAKQYVEAYLSSNGIQNIYSSSNQSYGIYVNWTNKSITLHGPTSYDWISVQNYPHSQIGNIYKVTKNGLWIGPFDNILFAYGYAELLKKYLYLICHEETSLSSSNGINNNPTKPF